MKPKNPQRLVSLHIHYVSFKLTKRDVQLNKVQKTAMIKTKHTHSL
jgi:hypothetical protein